MNAERIIKLLATFVILNTFCLGVPYWSPDLVGNDDKVNFADFAAFALNWQSTGNELAGDFDNSGKVDTNDLSYFAGYWLSDVNWPDYYADELPYLTSFEPYQGYYAYDGYSPASLDYQKGWQVISGQANIYTTYFTYNYEDYYYRYARIEPNSTIVKEVNDMGSYNTYIRCELVVEEGAEVKIISDSNTIAGIRVGSNGYVEVLDNGSYESTSQQWNNSYWCKVTFVMDYYSNEYDVIWTDYYYETEVTIKTDAIFGRDYDLIDSVEFSNSNIDWYAIDGFSITNQSSEGGEFGAGNDIYITTPCACATDDPLQGKIPITGSVWYEGLGWYKIYLCPSDLEETEPDNWQLVTEGNNVVIDDILGYWDTSLIPNGYYFLIIQVSDDYEFAQPAAIVINEIIVDDVTLYNDVAYYPVTGDLKCNTFYHEEEPDISVDWPGHFPFEFRRIYNNNKRFYAKPLRNGWTNNNYITLTEDSTYYWDTTESGLWDIPSYDSEGIGFGYIWVTYPNGSKQLFKHQENDVGYNPSTYEPYPKGNCLDIVKRRTWDSGTIFDPDVDVSYTLIRRDGTELEFHKENLALGGYWGHIPTGMWFGYYGTIGWQIQLGIDSMSDRFGNELYFDWNSSETTIESITDGTRTIELDITNDFYTEARLEIDSQTYRTITYEWDNNNKIYTVAKEGYGVDANGIYSGTMEKQYQTKYQYEEITGSGLNLTKIAYSGDLSKPSIEVQYDGYSRVEVRKDYVDPCNYLTTDFTYEFYRPSGSWYLRTIADTPYRSTITVQGENGNMLEQRTITGDGSAVTDVNAFYNDSYYNPTRPTDVNEYFDGYVRRSQNDYSYYGDLIEQKIFLDDVNYIDTKFEYHPSYGFETSRTSWQDVNKTGPLVQKLSVYGDVDGTEDEYGDYLVKEKVLLSEDPNVWAVTSYEYYDNGQIKKKTDPNSFVKFYLYDDNGYVKLIKQGTADSNTPVQRFYHDSIGQRLIVANNLGGVVLNDYDDFGRLCKVRKYEDSSAMSRSDATFIPSTYESMSEISTIIYGYDSQGNQTYEQKCDCGGGEIHTDYTVSGLPKQVSYNDGSYIQNSYDARGLKTYEYRYDANSTQDSWVANAFDDMDRRIQTIWYDYDDANIVKAETMGYYGSGRVEYHDIYGYGFALEKQTDFDYDVLGRLTKRIVAPVSFNLTTQYGYDAANNQISVTDPNGNIILYDYDNANRRTAEYFAAEDVESAGVKKEIFYYANGQIKDVNSYDYDGSLLAYSNFEYDERGRVTTVTQDINETQQAVTVYDYSDTGFGPGSEYHIRITDANDNITYRKLCPFGHLIKVLHPSGDYEELEYNADCTLKRKAVWDANDTKHWIEYFYDDYARLTDVNYPDGGNVHYTYDGFGRKILVEDNRNATDNIGGTEQISYEYDVLDRIVKITEQDDYDLEYAYQADGQKQYIKVYEPNDSPIYHVEYYYDSASRLKWVTEPLLGDPFSCWIAEFSYDLNGNREQLRYYKTGDPFGSTIDVDYTYDMDNNLRGYSTTGGPTFTLEDTVVDGLGRLLDANETAQYNDTNNIYQSLSYQYDMLGRLIYLYTLRSDPHNDDYHEDYLEYDRVGNMVRRLSDVDGDIKEYNYVNVGNLRTGMSYGAYNFIANFDLNGRQTNRLLPDPNSLPIQYNWDGGLVFLGNPNVYAQAKYTPDGLCVWRKKYSIMPHHDPNYPPIVSSDLRKHIIDPVGKFPRILMILDANDANLPVHQSFIHAQNQAICQHEGDYTSERYFLLHDKLGSVRLAYNTNSTLYMSTTFDPWGGQLYQFRRNLFNTPYRWAGYYYDNMMGYYLNARYYQSERFLTRDPVRGEFNDPMSLHPYLYCMNDPINRTDPSGELWGTVRSSYRTIYGISAYYTGLAMGLQFAVSPWDIMDVAIAANKWREAYFNPENLNKPFNWQNIAAEAYEKVKNACDWKPLINCIGSESWGYIKDYSREQIAVLILQLGCDFYPEPVTKVSFCAAHIVASVVVAVPVNEIDLMVGISDCFHSHCGK